MRVTIQGTGNKRANTFLFLEVDATAEVMVVVNGVRQAWCDPKMAQFFGEEYIYRYTSFKLNIEVGSQVTVVGEGFQVAIVGSMDAWQWVSIGDVTVEMNSYFHER